jgi:hypothetical protein
VIAGRHEPSVVAIASERLSFSFIGVDLPCRFRPTFDFGERKAYLDRASDYPTRIPNWFGAEISSLKSPFANRWIHSVLSVGPASPVALAGVRPGDMLLRVGSLDTTGQTRAEVMNILDTFDTETLDLLISRGTKQPVVARVTWMPGHIPSSKSASIEAPKARPPRRDPLPLTSSDPEPSPQCVLPFDPEPSTPAQGALF